jgi:gamma-glutamylcysteine synthetase
MARDQVDLTPIERRDELVDWIAQGVRPKSQFRIGTEHEKFAFTLEGHRPVPYEGPRGIRALLEGMQHLLGWQPIMEGRTSSACSTSPAAARSRSSRAASSSCPARRSKPCIRPRAN